MEQSQLKPERRDGIAIFLLGTGTAFGAGNVSPVVPELASDFDLSLTGVGLLAGTVYFAAMVVGLAITPHVAERVGVVNGLRLSCLLAAIGSLLFAVAPGVAVLGLGRIVAGLGLGFAGVLGPVYARETGGLARVGAFGGSFQLGIGAGLVTGSLLADADVGWRVGFVVSALAAASALPLLREASQGIVLSRRQGGSGFLALAARTPRVYRLGTLFVAMFSVPLLLGAWLVHYLSVQGGMAVGLAGVLSFVLFGVSALLRIAGADLAARGFPRTLLRAGAPLLATIGVAILAIDQALGFALIAVLAMAAGFALPYALMIVAAQRLYPEEPADPVSLLTTIATGLPILLIPLFGAALSDGYGEESLIAIAAFIALAGALNVKPANQPLRGEPG